MPVQVDTHRLLVAIVYTLSQDIIPALQDEDAIRTARGIRKAVMRAIGDHDLLVEEQSLTGRISRRSLVEEDLQRLEKRRAFLRDIAAGFETNTDGPALPKLELLSRCAQAHLSDDGDIQVVSARPISIGGSKQTFLFEVDMPDRLATFVMRRDVPNPSRGQCVTDEFSLLEALHTRNFPSPVPVWSDSSELYLSRPYIVTELIVGQPAGDFAGRPLPEIQEPARLLARLLAQLHAIDFNELRIEKMPTGPARPMDLLEVIDSIGKNGGAFGGKPPQVVLIALSWLRENHDVGAGERPVIVHGDAGFHNIVIRPDGCGVMCDWELAHIGAAAEDLCYARGPLEGLIAFDDFLDLYEAEGGVRPGPEALDFYEILHLVRGATVFGTKVAEFNRGWSNQVAGVESASALYYSYLRRLGSKLLDIMPSNPGGSPSVACR